MNKLADPKPLRTEQTALLEPPAQAGDQQPRRLAFFALYAALLALAFIKPLIGLARFALHSSLYSHILLIPFISAYLVWINRCRIPFGVASRSRWAALPMMAGGLALLAAYMCPSPAGAAASHDPLFFSAVAFVSFIIAGGLWFLGAGVMRPVAIPAGLLFFLAPFPRFFEHAIEVFFQHTSASAAALLFALTSTPVFHDGLLFKLPGTTIEVAEECSGIHSSLVLFITSIIAGYLFLKRPWKRFLLAAFVIPLAMIRNGFRIVVISMLCVHVDPNMINSTLHRRGGPIFFLLSLVPFFLLLLWLRKTDRETNPAAPSTPGSRKED